MKRLSAPSRPLALVDRLLSTLWFLPATLVALAVGLAVGLVELDARLTVDLGARLPRLFGAGAEGSRGMLQAIAGSMITVAGLTFSITMVTLTLASSQYSPRMLRTFKRDRFNQVVLGTFLGAFAYCLVVLRTVRGGDEGQFVPSLAVLFAFFLALAGVVLLIVFIDHVASSIQVATILTNLRRETDEVVEALFPDADEPDDPGGAGGPPATPDLAWHAVPARRSGYVQHADFERLAGLARARDVVVRLERGVGDFVVARGALAYVGGAPPDADLCRALGGCFEVHDHRTIEQDAAFGLQVLVDIALKALSPGVNDTTTAGDALLHVTAVLANLAGRRVETPHRFDGGVARVLAREVDFARFVALAFGPLRRNAAGNVTVLRGLIEALGEVAHFTRNARRRRALLHELELICGTVSASVQAAEDREALEACARAVRLRLRPPPQGSEHPLR
ncbi:MAG TPA: DUF2254 domain-containing protein [Polyangiaceae bacterium]|nr:DUF2254 domain-containing protein [Polyangiaceae bacterium]